VPSDAKIESKKIVVALLLALPALLIYACDLFGHQGDLSAAVAVRLTGGQLMHEGLTPYVDFWDWSQPINYWLCSWPYAINSALEGIPYYVPPELSFKVAFFVLVLASIGLTLTVLEFGAKKLPDDHPQQSHAANLFVPLLTGFVAALFCTRFEAGVLQQVFMLSLMPWLTMRWLRYLGVSFAGKVGNFLALAGGLLLGLGIILDIPHLPVVVGLEIFFVLAYGGKYKFDLSIFAGLAVGLIDFIYLHGLPRAMHQAFWQWTMPIRARQFTRFDASISAYVASPDRRDALYMMIFAVVMAFLLQARQDFLRPLIAVTALGLALYVGEGDGLTSSLVVALWGTSFLLSLSIWQLLQSLSWARLKPQILSRIDIKAMALPVVTMAALALAFTVSLNKDREAARLGPMLFKDQAKVDIFDVLNNYSRTGESVIILCDYPMPIYPLLFDLDRRPGSYLLWSRPLRVLNALRHFSAMTPALSDFEKFVYDGLENSISRGQSPVILIAKNSIAGIVEKSALKKALDSAYEVSGECYYCSVNKDPAEYCGFEQGFDIYRRRAR